MAAAEEQPTHDPLGLGRLLKDCSSLQTVRGVITRIRRLAAKARGEAHRLTPPNGKEITFADNLLIRYVQQSTLHKELSALKEGKGVHKGSVLRDLPVYYDKEDDLLRLQSRLHTASSLTFDWKNPIIVPKSDLAKRLALEVHQRDYHCSQRAAFSTLRQRYWYCGGFRYVKDAVRQCKTPRCRYIKYGSPKMSPLPSIRIDNPEP